MRRILFLLFLVSGFYAHAQSEFHCIVKDSTTGEVIPGAIILQEGTNNGTTSDVDGTATLKNIPGGEQLISVSYAGYFSWKKKLNFPLAESSVITVFLQPKEEEVVIVSSSRTNSRIDDLNQKVEVLGQEDMDEESTLVPGTVTSILGDLSIITVQRTSPVTGNDAIRMQGLDARYTQLMRDGFPLYGGFSGSLGVLSIPPLDLKQVEIIKGSASTLYGGGAIGGLINFISKTPADSMQAVLTLNGTTQQEYNLNAFGSGKHGKTGMTLFTGANFKTAFDVNKDGFTEVPQERNFSIHPRFFFDLNPKSKLILGISSAYETRAGGDILAVKDRADSIHTFLVTEKTFRNTGDLTFEARLNEKNTLTVKTALSIFNRASDADGFYFNGTQFSSYSEFSEVFRLKKHTIIGGVNFTGEALTKNSSDSVLFHDYSNSTTGIFVQDEWQLAKKLSLQTGMRVDHLDAYGDFYLPRISFFYKPGDHLSVRLGAGTGYKIPQLFDLIDPSSGLLDIPSNVLPEYSYGSNADINYHTLLFDKLNLNINQAFYYTHILNPTIIITNYLGQFVMQNAGYDVNSYGTDTYVRLQYAGAEFYLGYNHTESLLQNSSVTVNMPFNPKDKLSGTLAYEVKEKWRMGLEASWTGNQYIYNNEKVHDFLFMAAMVERKFRRASVVLNCENLLDARQSKFETIVSGPVSDPVFRPTWAPLEGRVINLSVKINL
jgi:iron complex outermembrane receptor protein/outer membrane receptor for ferrienterochelin and colicins